MFSIYSQTLIIHKLYTSWKRSPWSWQILFRPMQEYFGWKPRYYFPLRTLTTFLNSPETSNAKIVEVKCGESFIIYCISISAVPLQLRKLNIKTQKKMNCTSLNFNSKSEPRTSWQRQLTRPFSLAWSRSRNIYLLLDPLVADWFCQQKHNIVSYN